MGVNQTLLQKVADEWNGVPFKTQGRDILGKLNAQRRAAGGEVSGAQQAISKATTLLNQPGSPRPDTRWQSAGQPAPSAQPTPSMKEIPPALKSIPQTAPASALGAGGAGMAAPRSAGGASAAGVGGAAAPQSPQRVNPYDDPNYDHFANPGLDPIKHMLNFARPARKALYPSLYPASIQSKRGAAAMSINPELLQKAAKVYEAAESVEGVKPKEVYESHKKCAPGEFNMHKEGYAQLQNAIKLAVGAGAYSAATHPMARQAQTAADNAEAQFNKTWNPMHLATMAKQRYLQDSYGLGESVGNAYGAARNFVVNNSRGPSMLQMHKASPPQAPKPQTPGPAPQAPAAGGMATRNIFGK